MPADERHHNSLFADFVTMLLFSAAAGVFARFGVFEAAAVFGAMAAVQVVVVALNVSEVR